MPAGTANFVHGFPMCAVSIGQCVNMVPSVGVVYDPYADELFVGVRGRGAFCNGRRLRSDMSVSDLTRALVLSEPGYERSPEGVAKILAVTKALLDANVQALRITGSAVLSIIWVACGRANAYFAGLHEKDCPKPWDWCAAYVIGLEAGATFSRCDARAYPGGAPASGHTFDIYSKSCIVAGTPQLCLSLRKTIVEALNEKQP